MENNLKSELKCEVCGETMKYDGSDILCGFNKNYYHCDNCDCCCIEFEKIKPTKRFWRADNFGFVEEWVEFLGGNENEKM